MKLILIRHGKASAGGADATRELTPEGIQHTRNGLMLLKKTVPNTNYIISSPLKRAEQTAALAAEIFSPEEEIIYDKNLAPGSKVEEITELANSLHGEVICFVGHNPDFSYHVADLISGSGAQVALKTGSIAVIEFSGQARLTAGTLTALIPAFAM